MAGRPELPLDPEAGPVQRLAHELRELRRAAGGPAYRAMAERAGCAASTLSQAAAGERLPSWPVVEGYARACGGDPALLEPLWQTARDQLGRAVREPDGDEPPPYRGLTRYETGDQHLFFGRDRAAGELGRLVCEHRLAVLFGASGSGKSSLLRAGLIPRLREAAAAYGRPAVLRVLTPGPRPATTYAHLLAPAAGEPESWVVVDQFEEVFTLCKDPAERTRFIDLLLTARDPDSRLRVLIAVRADFYARCGEHRRLADELCGAGLMLGPLTADELREVIVRPAQQAGLLVERELTARLVEEVSGRPEALPMLSHALLETWRRRRGRALTLAAYEAAGGVRGAVAATAEELYRQLTPAQARIARHLLLRMVEPGLGTPDTRRPLSRAELAEHTNPDVPLVLDRLTRARLLTVDQDGAQLAHEALISRWPRLSGWVEEDRERLRHRSRLAEVARAWHDHGRDPGALYRGAALARAEELFPDHDLLTRTEHGFLTAALDARDAERRAATRAARRHRGLLTTLSAVLATALAVTAVAWTQHRYEKRQDTAITARRVADVADALRTTDPRTALLLGVAAWRISPLPESRRALLGSLAQTEDDAFTDPAPGTTPRRFLLDSGHTLLSVADGHWTAWDVATRTRRGDGTLPEGEALAAGGDGRVLAVSRPEGIRLWDTRTSRWTGDPKPMPDWTNVRLGRALALVRDTEDGRVRLRSATDGRVLLQIPSPGPADPALSTDDRTAAICPDHGTPQVWDTAARRRLPGAWDHATGLCDPAADADTPTTLRLDHGRLLVLTADTVHVWDVSTGRALATLADSGVSYASLSTDGAFAATVDSGELRVWRLSDPYAPVLRHGLDNQHPYDGPAWDPDRPALRYLEGGTVHTLDVTATVTPAWRARPLDRVLLSPDGTTVATAEHTGTHYTFRLAATRGGAARTLPAPPLPVPAGSTDTIPLMAFDAHGTALAYGIAAHGLDTTGQRLTVWDTRQGRVRHTLDLAPTPAEPVIALALGPAGRTVHAVRIQPSGDLQAETWDTATARRTRVLPGLPGPALAVSPDGRLLVGDNRATLLPDAPSADRDLVLGEEITALAFGTDGSRLAAGAGTGRVALWDGRLRRRAGILRNAFPPSLDSTPESVAALAFSPDGTTLAVGGSAGTLQLWDTRTQQPLGAPLTTPGEAVQTLSFSADGATLYAGSAHVPLQRHPVDPPTAVRTVCARAGGADLTPERWQTYIPDAPYRRLCG
ncbi:helix-turn-helix domain-containing protein [Streptomyces sp. 4F14]|uniref:nSTAND1 domain-containing NTPase n=1 Tax=Streptomyces sp. 4F14 TaxID=3394380 RepID=UPI003A83C85C